MNLANKLTVFRMVLIPFFLLFFLTDFSAHNRLVALIIFVVATITDKLDGTIAKRTGTVTNFGKFMDPMADKLLVCSALICLCAKNELPAWVVLIIIAREFAISGIRQIAADNGVAIAASSWGKAKTVAQMFMITVLLLDGIFHGLTLGLLPEILIYTSVVLTVVSLGEYIIKNRKVITMGEM